MLALLAADILVPDFIDSPISIIMYGLCEPPGRPMRTPESQPSQLDP